MKVYNQKLLSRIYSWLKSFLWRRETVYGVFFILLLTSIVYLISVIPKNASLSEVNYATNTSNISNIGENPLYLPHKGISYLVNGVSDSVRAVRAISFAFLGVCIIALYRILKRWHSDKVALFSATMFATNATVLSVGRLGTPLVLLLGWSIVISILLWLQHGSSRKVAPFTLGVISSALLFVPGAPYFFILLAVLFGKKLLRIVRNMSRPSLALVSFSVILIISPLALSFFRDIELLKQWLLLPPSIDWGLVPRNILRVPSAFIYRSPVDPMINVGRLPVFDVAAGGLFLIGLYAYKVNIKLERTRIMLLCAVFAIVLGTLGQVTTAIILVLPFAYAVIGAGISYILDVWYGVFPKNPFARSFGIILVTLVVIASMYYQLTRFLVVWPQTIETRERYNQSRIIE